MPCQPRAVPRRFALLPPSPRTGGRGALFPRWPRGALTDPLREPCQGPGSPPGELRGAGAAPGEPWVPSSLFNFLAVPGRPALTNNGLCPLAAARRYGKSTRAWLVAAAGAQAAQFTYLLPVIISNWCRSVSTRAAGIPYVARSLPGGLGEMTSLLRFAVSGCSTPVFGNVLPPKVHSAKVPCLRMFRTHQALWSQATPKPGKLIKLL